MKRLLPLEIKMYLKYLLSKKDVERYKEIKNKKKIIVALAADYGNLGDVAITYAQTKFLKTNFPEYIVIDYPISETFSAMKSLEYVINEDDIITMVGGGNTGDMYKDIEYARRFIINKFPKNKIISFPQTVDFSDTLIGNKTLEKSKKIYSKHSNLTLVAREEKTFNIYKNEFDKNKILLFPDIVLYLETNNFFEEEREGINLCLRKDNEKVIDYSVQEKLIDELGKKYFIKYRDTHIDKNKMALAEREEELKSIWKDFMESKIVITDRLHGMIFCAITNTPCIAIDNSNKKISGVYNKWLKDFSFIKMVSINEFEKIEELCESVFSDFQPSFKSNDRLKNEFSKFASEILNDL